MIQTRTLESLITERIALGPVSNTGFHTLKCECCHDYKVRAGFRFEGGQILYSCFNCGLKPMYEEGSGQISKKFRGVLNDFGISNDDIDKVVNSAFFAPKNEDATITLETMQELDLSTPEIKLPPNTFRIGLGGHDEVQIPLVEYLSSRHIDVNGYPFFYSLEQRYKNRVIIPFYRNRKLIYWQARTIERGVEPRYDNCSASKTAVMFNMDQLTSWSEYPLFVTEGVFDALPLNGVALMGSYINPNKLELLNRSKRRLVFVIDPDDNGRQIAEKALENGWEITFLDNKMDVNDAIIKYGRLWTVYTLMKNIPKNNFEANLKIKLQCK